MALQLAMPMFRDVPRISLDDIEDYFNTTWKPEVAFENKEIKDGTFVFNIGESLVAFTSIDGPIPWSDLEGPCATSVLWPTATQDVPAHTHHLIVTVSDGELSPVDISILLTKVTAAIIATQECAMGVSWCNATMVVPKNVFIEFSERVLPNGPPVHIWVDFRVGSTENNTTSGFTTGMESLGLMEIEAINTPEPFAHLKDRLTGMADYLIMNGPVIKDGDTVGEDEHELIKVVYGKSYYGNDNQVMTLQYEKATPKKSRLKFW